MQAEGAAPTQYPEGLGILCGECLALFSAASTAPKSWPLCPRATARKGAPLRGLSGVPVALRVFQSCACLSSPRLLLIRLGCPASLSPHLAFLSPPRRRQCTSFRPGPGKSLPWRKGWEEEAVRWECRRPPPLQALALGSALSPAQRTPADYLGHGPPSGPGKITTNERKVLPGD